MLVISFLPPHGIDVGASRLVAAARERVLGLCEREEGSGKAFAQAVRSLNHILPWAICSRLVHAKCCFPI